MVIKKKRKKNPNLTPSDINDLKTYLKGAITYGYPRYLISAIILSKQGFRCKDCNNEFFNCECEKCNECNLDRCLCEYNIDDAVNDSNKVREISWNLAKEIFNENQLQDFIKNLKYVTELRYNRKDVDFKTVQFIFNLIKT